MCNSTVSCGEHTGRQAGRQPDRTSRVEETRQAGRCSGYSWSIPNGQVISDESPGRSENRSVNNSILWRNTLREPFNLLIFVNTECLIESKRNGLLAVNKTVLQELKKLDKQVVVVVTAGPYRTGKSYLMNRLADLRTGQIIIQFCGEILAFNYFFIHNKKLQYIMYAIERKKNLFSNGPNQSRIRPNKNEFLMHFVTIVEDFARGFRVQSETNGIWILARIHPNDANKYLILLDTEGLGDVEKVIIMFIIQYFVGFSDARWLKCDRLSKFLHINYLGADKLVEC